MKKHILFLLACLLLYLGCGKSDDNPTTRRCGTHNGKQLYKGPDGGCFYYNSNGGKEYVGRSECNC